MPPKRSIEVAEDAGQVPRTWNDLVIAELKVELEKRGLPKAAKKEKKADLVARLEAYGESPDDNITELAPIEDPSVVDAPATPLKPKAKRAKKAKSPDPIVSGKN
jgi:hypothetical protein